MKINLSYFWKDKWVTNSALQIHTNINHEKQVVADFINPNGNWDTHKLLQLLPYPIVAQVHKIKLNKLNQEDEIIWEPTTDGVFTVKSANRKDVNTNNHTNSLNWIWKLNIPPYIKNFI